EGVDFFYFTTRGVNFDERYIRGYYYEKGKWKEKLYPFPDVIINSANQKTRKQNQIYYRLEKIVPYTSYPVGSKVYTYNKLRKSNFLKKYLIPFKEVEDISDILLFLDKYKEIIVKPIRGHHGDGVIKIEEHVDKFRVIEKQELYDFNLE